MKPDSAFCRVYAADVSPLASSALFDALYQRVPAARREKIGRLRSPASRRLSLGAGLLLLLALDSAGVCAASAVFAEGPHGKPYLADFPDLHFNLSHSGSRVLCVLSSLPCGCDVERLGRGSEALARRFFTPAEAAALAAERASDGEAAFSALFARIWTRKESFLKATGEGLFRPMNTFSVLSPPPAAHFFDSTPDPAYACCVCLLAPHKEKGPGAFTAWPLVSWISVSLENLNGELQPFPVPAAGSEQSTVL